MGENHQTEMTVDSAAAELGKMRAAAEAPQDNTVIEGNDVDDRSKPDTAATAATGQDDNDSPPEQQDADEAGQEDADSSDAEQVSNIEPPAWFTSEEKELFKALPPEQQGPLLRLAKSEQAAISRKQNEHQEALRVAQAKTQAAEQARQYLESQIQQYKHPLVQAFQRDFPDVVSGQMDPFRLSQDPQRWSKYQAYQQSFNQIAQTERAIQQQKDADEAERFNTFVEERNELLVEYKPDLKDPAKFEAFDTEVTNYLLALKTPVQRIKEISFEELKVVEKAMLWDKAQKAKTQVPKTNQPGPGQVAVQGHTRTVPKVLKPGGANNGGQQDDRFDAAVTKLRNTGSTDDAAGALAQLRARMTRKSA